MLAATLLNLEPVFHGTSTWHRRPGERFTTQDDWLKAQEELTKLKARPNDEQKRVAKKAIDVVKKSSETFEAVSQAKEYIDTSGEAIDYLDRLEVVLVAYFMLQYNNKQKNISAMLMLGIL
jgi:hypothetical protein